MRTSDVFSPPPPHAARFRSDHLDEIHAFIAAYDGSHRRAALGPGPLGHSVRSTRCGEVDVGWSLTRTRQRIRGTPQAAILHVPLARRHVYATHGKTLEARPDTAILLAPGQENTLFFEPDDCIVALRVPGSALADELLHRDPARGLANLVTREIPLAGDRLGTLAVMQRSLVGAAGPATAGASTQPADQIGAHLVSWIADQVLGTRPSSSATALGIQRIRMVEEWIDAHLGEPITLGRLCAVAGVGDRYLESTFRAHRGETPLQFVTARRLARARRSLLESGPGHSVTQVAHDAGFVHLGRFAARYRSTYCESPSATLRRGVQQC
ncbi:MAG: helix-turn-helix transcriptional regulator [Burkholderiales bacterium]